MKIRKCFGEISEEKMMMDLYGICSNPIPYEMGVTIFMKFAQTLSSMKG